MARELGDRQHRTQAPYAANDPPRFGQPRETIVDALVAGLTEFFDYDRQPSTLIEELPSIRKYVTRPSPRDNRATVVTILKNDHQQYEKLPQITVRVDSDTDVPTSIGPRILALVQEPPRITTLLPGPYLLEDGAILAFQTKPGRTTDELTEHLVFRESRFADIEAVTAVELAREVNAFFSHIEARVVTVGAGQGVEFRVGGLRGGVTPNFIEIGIGTDFLVRDALGLGLVEGLLAELQAGATYDVMRLIADAGNFTSALVGRRAHLVRTPSFWEHDGAFEVLSFVDADTLIIRLEGRPEATPNARYFIPERDDHLNLERPPMTRSHVRTDAQITIEVATEDDLTRTELADIVKAYFNFFWGRSFFHHWGRGLAIDTTGVTRPNLERWELSLAPPIRTSYGKTSRVGADGPISAVWFAATAANIILNEYIDRELEGPDGTSAYTDAADFELREPLEAETETPEPVVPAPIEINPLPVIASLEPETVEIYSATFPLTVTGTGFVEESVVSIDGVDLVTTYISPTELEAQVPAAQLLTGRVADIVVTSPGPGGGESEPEPFPVENPVPVLNSLTPDNVYAGAGNTTVVLSGSDFAPNATVTFGGAAIAAVVDSVNQITATVPAAAIANDDAYDVVVTNPAPGGGVSEAVPFYAYLALTQRPMLNIGGQSNALDSMGTPALSTTQPPGTDNLRRSGTTAIGLVEPDAPRSLTGESVASAIGNAISAMDPGRNVIVHNWAQGATSYESMAPGTAFYNAAVAAIADARNAVIALRPAETPHPGAFLVVHGETNDSAPLLTSAAAYAAFMVTWQTSMQADHRTIFGTPTARVPLIMTQHAAWTMLNPLRDYSEVAIGQWMAARNNPDIVGACPLYPMTYAASGADIHLNNIGRRRAGRYVGRAGMRSVIQHRQWNWLEIDRADAVNNVITVRVRGGDGSAIVRDITQMQVKPFDGFEYSDGQADIPAVSNVSITGPDEIAVTLTRNAAAGGRIRFAYSAVPGAGAGPTSVGGPGGNIRDQDPTPSGDGDAPLQNWLVGFDHPLDSVSGAASPPWTFSNTQSFDVTTTPTPAGFASARRLSATDGLSAATFLCWLRLNSSWPGSDQVLFSKSNLNQRHIDCRILAATSGSVRTFLPATITSTSTFLTSTAGIVIGAWQLFGVTVSLPGVAEHWNNAVQLAATLTGSLGAALTSGARSDFEIGASSAGLQNFSGNYAHFAIFPRRFVQADWDEARNGGAARDMRTLSGGGPLHYWPLQGTFEDVGSAASMNLFPYGRWSFEAIAP